MVNSIFHTFFFSFREEWMTAIKGVSERLSDVEEVEMEGVSHSTSMSSTMSGPSSDDFSAKFSVQGTSSSKSTGKRKVVCIIIYGTVKIKNKP